MGPNHHKHSQIIKKKKGEGAKNKKGIFGEIMHPNQTKYSQISEEKKQKGAKSTKGFFVEKMGPSHHIMKEKIQAHHI